jgi:hypothetical protein
VEVDVRIFDAGVAAEDDEAGDRNEYECYGFEEADQVDELGGVGGWMSVR